MNVFSIFLSITLGLILSFNVNAETCFELLGGQTIYVGTVCMENDEQIFRIL